MYTISIVPRVGITYCSASWEYGI